MKWFMSYHYTSRRPGWDNSDYTGFGDTIVSKHPFLARKDIEAQLVKHTANPDVYVAIISWREITSEEAALFEATP